MEYIQITPVTSQILCGSYEGQMMRRLAREVLGDYGCEAAQKGADFSALVRQRALDLRGLDPLGNANPSV